MEPIVNTNNNIATPMCIDEPVYAGPMIYIGATEREAQSGIYTVDVLAAPTGGLGVITEIVNGVDEDSQGNRSRSTCGLSYAKVATGSATVYVGMTLAGRTVLKTFPTAHVKAVMARLEVELGAYKISPRVYSGWAFCNLAYYVAETCAAVGRAHDSFEGMEALRRAGPVDYMYGLDGAQRASLMRSPSLATSWARRRYQQSDLPVNAAAAERVVRMALRGLPCGQPVFMAQVTAQIKQLTGGSVTFRAKPWKPLVQTIGAELGYEIYLKR